jgi:Spy/CpxP family protein refolding chaperone
LSKEVLPRARALSATSTQALALPLQIFTPYDRLFTTFSAATVFPSEYAMSRAYRGKQESLMKSFHSRLLIAALAVLMGTAMAQSQTSADAPPPQPMHGHGHGMGMGMDGHMGFFAKQLNLTDDQKAQMKAILQKEHPAMKPLFEQQHQIDVQLRQYVEGSFDQAKVQALAAQKAEIQAQMTVAETRVHNQLYQLLTADQQSQLKQMEANREAHKEQRRNHMNQAPSASPEQQ